MKNKEIKIIELWNNEKQNELRKFILFHSNKQRKERMIVNELLSIQYKIEDYIR